MYRCALAAFAATVCCISAQAQVHRNFPVQTLRGELVILQSPDVSLNGHAARLAPGARVRGDTNLLQQPASLMGQKHTVHYTVEPSGLLLEIWVLNPAELANKTWPRSREDAAKWSFDQASQVWTKP